MAIYVIGDIQGCYDPFMQLLEKVRFDPLNDKLWLVGDLVNRGGQSLEVLNMLHQLDDAVVSVLGNHDISLIACYHGLKRPNLELQRVLDAPNIDQLMAWLVNKPLMHVDKDKQLAMVHAGISPQWDMKMAQRFAKEVQVRLQQADVKHWLEAIYGDQPCLWSDSLSGAERHRYIINVFTRMRYCQVNGQLELQFKESPQELSLSDRKLYPWFKVPNRKPLGIHVLFGHWSTLGYRRSEHLGDQFTSLDTGCVWGGQLTAIRIDDQSKAISNIQCNDYGR